MPFIDVKVSCPLASAQELSLKAELGKAIALIPGKSEGSLMVQFTDNCRLWFGGAQDGPIAMAVSYTHLLSSTGASDYTLNSHLRRSGVLAYIPEPIGLAVVDEMCIRDR